MGRHRLGSHVVGQRVVVRRLVRGETGPSGGPAMTDLLGVCEAFGDGVLVVRPEGAASVTVALADVVSGKPVPPRPSLRDR
ncbi:MAG: family N-acetyltransferase, partial [Nocardioides sp.]|nr:family N-acetyltransferase [Nocardioides sp.]